MDSRLEEKLERLDEHIKKLFLVEHEYLLLDGNKKALLAALTLEAKGKSHAERETLALASPDWKDFSVGFAGKAAEYNREKRRHELLLKAFDAEYTTLKIESQSIRRQL